MDVKDVRSSKGVQEKPSRDVESSSNSRRSVVSLVTRISENSQVNAQAVRIDTSSRGSVKSEVRGKLNEVINVSNTASEATSQIAKLVKSIDGIAEQVQSEELPEQRKAILEEEANQLVEEIKRTAQTPALNGTRPLAGEKIRLEVEERIGKTLEIILPDEATNAFGIGKVAFSTKESIISTIANIEAAEQSIIRLKEAVETASRAIEDTASSVEVAFQNSEAAEASVRDLDTALKLAGETRIDIGKDPEKAIESVGKLDSSALGLLES